VDDVLAGYDYELTPAIEAIDAAVPGIGGLFDANTTRADLRSALDEVASVASPRTDERDHGANPSAVVLYVDGSCHGNPGPAGAGAVIHGETGMLARLGKPVGSKTGNNVAEYAALYLGLDTLVRWYDPETVEVRTDSMTVVKDVWKGHEPAERYAAYSTAISQLLSAIPAHDWTHLADSEPNPADARATVGADIAALGP
jgi:ribonuclease HI